MITYLYHKIHVKTGLNYFGKTTQNPYKYNGSGVVWRRHLKKHGNHVDTIQVWEFENLEECSKFALEFSIKNDIVNSKVWANLCLENGLDGGDKFSDMLPEVKALYSEKKSKDTLKQWESRDRKKQSEKISEIWNNRDKSIKDSISEKISNTLLNKSKTEREETLVKYRETSSKRDKIICPHCGLVGLSAANMKRYHFNNCTSHPTPLPRKPITKIQCINCNKISDPGNFTKHHGQRCKVINERQ